ncbi:hypothetical protein BDF19DRAFT_436587 [Syncephalis fuscata]|nr:hypothetical protein BDF19DRAFT_436587 [Syncephalis fuscata]
MLGSNAGAEIDKNWTKNATYLWGIPLHPSGEMDIDDFFKVMAESPGSIHDHLKGIWMQLVVHFFVGCIHARNINIALRMIIVQPRAVTRWCCLLPSLAGAVLSIISLLFYFLPGINCRILCWYAGLEISISIICYSTILLQKAYVILDRQRWVIVVGILFISPQAGIPIIVITSTVIILSFECGCVIIYPPYLAWYWFGISLLANVFFSSIFSYTAYKQYRVFGSETWKRLAKDGIQAMCLVMLCNIVCSAMLCFRPLGDASEFFFLIDCLISSVILIKNCQEMHYALRLSNRPRTDKMLHISQVPLPINKGAYNAIT